jgi:putative tryptophan/tyrosine transport system substrate-binding protein
MRRREFIAGLAVAWPLVAQVQQAGKSYRIGVLAPGPRPSADDPPWVAFKQGFSELGYVEGQNLILERRFAEGDLERLPALVSELAATKVDAIVVLGPTPMRAAKAGARDIPIVMVAGSSDPIGEGYIASFARPGGNITGLTYAVSAERFGKQLELLREAAGPLLRIGVLWDLDLELFHRSWSPALNEAGRQFGLQVEGPFLVRDADSLDRAVAAMVERQIEAVLVATGGIIFQNRGRLAALAGQRRLPVMAAFRDFPATGSLMSYGPNLAAIYRRAAAFVDKIVKGAPPGEIPVEQPTKYDLVINLKTAAALGLTIPPPLLSRADEVIE